MSGQYTPGPWGLEHSNVWPWEMRITGPDMTMDRVAYSTGQKSLDDMRCAKGFPHQDRDKIIEAIREQEANARLISAGPDLLEACEALLERYRIMVAADGPECLQAIAAIAKAKGESA